MNRTFGIIVSTVVWCALVAYLIFAAQHYVRAQDETVLSDVKIRVIDFDRRQLVSAAKSGEGRREEGVDVAGTGKGSINTEKIRQAIAKHGLDKDVRVDNRTVIHL